MKYLYSDNVRIHQSLYQKRESTDQRSCRTRVLVLISVNVLSILLFANRQLLLLRNWHACLRLMQLWKDINQWLIIPSFIMDIAVIYERTFLIFFDVHVLEGPFKPFEELWSTCTTHIGQPSILSTTMKIIDLSWWHLWYSVSIL